MCVSIKARGLDLAWDSPQQNKPDCRHVCWLKLRHDASPPAPRGPNSPGNKSKGFANKTLQWVELCAPTKDKLEFKPSVPQNVTYLKGGSLQRSSSSN